MSMHVIYSLLNIVRNKLHDNIFVFFFIEMNMTQKYNPTLIEANFMH